MWQRAVLVDETPESDLGGPGSRVPKKHGRVTVCPQSLVVKPTQAPRVEVSPLTPFDRTDHDAFPRYSAHRRWTVRDWLVMCHPRQRVHW